MPKKKSKKKTSKAKTKKLHHKIHDKAKDWDAYMKRYKFYKMLAKDLLMGVAFLGTVGGSVFKGTMRMFGFDHPSLPSFLGGKEDALTVASIPPHPHPQPVESARSSGGSSAEEVADEDDFAEEMEAELARDGEAIEHLGDSGITLASAPIPQEDNAYLMAQTTAPTYAQKAPETHELVMYYVPHVFWLMCISFVTWRVSKGIYAWIRRKRG